ncbi:tape measure protein, partial [Castellaniella hirudinis]|uniref:tape measure protein n=1 Tax=Castellaniella hirudinis TaxID=1144617 RepID=UPI0039C17D5B
MKVASLEIELLANIARLRTDMRSAQGVVERSMSSMRRNIDMVQRALSTLGVGVGLGVLVRQAQQLTDAYINLHGQLKNATRSQAELAQAMSDVRRIATTSQANIEGVATAYARFSNNLRDTGIQQQKIADITETVALALKVNGASVAETTSAMQQLSQAFGKGKLDGDEFRTMMEASPNVMRRVADAIGVPFGALKDLAAQGKLTASVLADSLSDSAYLESLRTQAKEMYTISGAMTVLRNAVMEFVGTQAQASGVVSSLTAGIMALANNIDGIGRALLFIAATAIPTAVRALWSLSAAMLAIPGMQLVKLLSVAAGAALAFSDQLGFVQPVIDAMADSARAFGVVWDEIYGDAKKVTDELKAEVANLWQGIKDLTGDTSAKTWTDALMVGLARVADVAALVVRSIGTVIYAFNAVIADTKVALAWLARPDAISKMVAPEQSAKLEQEYQDALKSREAEIRRFNTALEGLLNFQGNKYEQAAIRAINTIHITSDAVALLDLTLPPVEPPAGIGKANSAYQTLIASIQTKIEQQRLEIATGDKASEADKLAIKITQELASGKLKLSASQRDVVTVMLATLKAGESELKQSQMLAASQKKQLDLSVAAVKSAYDEARQNEKLARQFGLTKVQVERLTVAQLQSELATAQSIGTDKDKIAALEHLIEAHQRSVVALEQTEIQEKQKAAWNQWQQDIGQIFDQVGQSLTDALFEGGKSGRDLIKSIFKALTLKILVQPVMGALQGMVTQQLGGLLGYQQPGQQGGGFDMPGGGSSIGQYLGDGISRVGSWTNSTSMMQFGNDFGVGYGLSSGAYTGALTDAQAAAFMGQGGSGGTQAGQFLGEYGGQILGYGSAIYSAIQGQYGSAIGQAIGTYIMPGIGTAVGGLIGSFADSMFGGEPQTRHGKSTVYEMTGELDLYRKHNEDEQSEAFYSSIEDMTRAAITGIENTFNLLGVNATLESLRARTDISQTGKGDGVSSGGAVLVNGQWREIGIPHSSDDTQFGYGGWSDAPVLPRLQVDLQMTMLEAFQAAAAEMPRAINAALDGIDIRSLDETGVATLAATINDMIVGAQALSAAMELLPFENLKNQSLDTYMSIIQLTGGLQNLQQLQASYIDNYYTEAEKQALQIESLGRVFESVGLVMPAVTNNADQMKAAFRGIMDSLDLTTEAGQRAYAALLGIQDGFAGLANSVGAVMGTMGMSAVDVAKSAFSALQAAVQRERDSINAQALAQQKALQDAMKGVSASVSELTGLTGKLQSALNSMTRTIDTQASFIWAQNRIDRALSVAKLTGVMPEGPDFDAALQAIQRPDAALYESFEDFQAAQLKSANLVKDLNELAGDQLSSQKSQLQTLEDQLQQNKDWQDAEMQRLDDILDTAKSQLDSALGLNESLMSLPEALAALAAAIAALGGGGANSYFAGNPDVRAAFEQGLFGDMTAAQAADWHYVQYGSTEGR